MAFEKGSHLGEYIRTSGAKMADEMLQSIPTAKRREGIYRIAAEFAAAANRKGGEKLLACTEGSIIRGVIWCLMSDLLPGGAQPQCYLIPRANKRAGITELTVMVGFHGLIDLATRAGYSAIHTEMVYAGEECEIVGGSDGLTIRHRIDPEVERTWDTLVAGYMTACDPEGRVVCSWMPKSEIEANRSNSDSYKWADKGRRDSTWHLWPLRMAKKTVIRDAFARHVLATDLRVDLGDEDDAAAFVGVDIIDAPRATAKQAPTTLSEWAEESPATREAPALPDHGEPVDELAAVVETREKVEAKPAARPKPKRARKPRSNGGMP